MVPRSDELIQTRTTLIHRLKNWKDQSSWQEFFNNYWRLIYNVARKAGLNDAEAQDVVQETMISVAKSMPDFNYNREVGSFKGWLLKLTRWRIVDQVRKHGLADPNCQPADENHAKLLEWQTVIDPASEELDKVWDHEWKTALLEAAMDNVRRQLNPRQYQIFDFYVNKNWAPQKVADKFVISVDRVYMAKYRVTELIQEEVKRLSREAN